MPSIQVVRSAERLHTSTEWLDSAHSFSFGHAYDPDNTHFGLLVAHNEDRLQPRSGFEPHLHRGVEIVTWMVEGALTHRDSSGRTGVARPGTVQVMAAGRGVEHSEYNDEDSVAHYVQMWIQSEAKDAPAYQVAGPDLIFDPTRAAGAASSRASLVPIASGLEVHRATSAIPLRQSHAAFLAARMQAGQSLELPDAPWVHWFVTRGEVDFEGERIEAGDAVRLTDVWRSLIECRRDAEVVVWQMTASA